MRSPGRPDPSRVVQRQFWRLIATGITSAEAALAVGMSVPVGTRWFRHAGGMPPIALAEPTGRYLSFEEREEIAILSEFLPRGLSEDELDSAIRAAIAATGASGGKDMGKVIAALRAEYPGRIDFSKASGRVKALLG